LRKSFAGFLKKKFIRPRDFVRFIKKIVVFYQINSRLQFFLFENLNYFYFFIFIFKQPRYLKRSKYFSKFFVKKKIKKFKFKKSMKKKNDRINVIVQQNSKKNCFITITRFGRTLFKISKGMLRFRRKKMKKRVFILKRIVIILFAFIRFYLRKKKILMHRKFKKLVKKEKKNTFGI